MTDQTNYGPTIIVALMGIIIMLGMIANELAPKQQTQPVDLQPIVTWLTTPVGLQDPDVSLFIPLDGLLFTLFASPLLLLTTLFWVVWFVRWVRNRFYRSNEL